jgi:phage-related protein
VQAAYYRDPDGPEPVNDFLDSLAPERQEEIDFKISLLNRVANNDPPLPVAHSSQVDGQLRELRYHSGRDLYRVLYQRSGNLFVLLHALAKRTRRPPTCRHRHRKEAVRRPPGAYGAAASPTSEACRA